MKETIKFIGSAIILAVLFIVILTGGIVAKITAAVIGIAAMIYYVAVILPNLKKMDEENGNNYD